MGTLWPLAMGFFPCELQAVKTHSNYFEIFYQSVADFMPFCVKMLFRGFGVQGLTILYQILCYNGPVMGT